LPPTCVGVRERDPVRQGLVRGPVEVHLELVPRLVVEPALDVGLGHGGVDVHDEDGAAVALEDVQVVDVELSVLGCEWRVQVVRQGNVLSLVSATGRVDWGDRDAMA